MDLKKEWKLWLVETNKSGASVARDIGQSTANLNKKIANDSIRAVELANILEHYGYTLKIVKREE